MILFSLVIYFLMPLTSLLCFSLGSNKVSLIFFVIFTLGLLVFQLWGVLVLIIFLVMFPLEVPVPPCLLVSRILPVFGSKHNMSYKYHLKTLSFTFGMSNAPCCSLLWVFPSLSLSCDTSLSLNYSLICLPCQRKIVLVLWAFTRKFSKENIRQTFVLSFMLCHTNF